MDDGVSLMRAIVAQPEEDTPRLMYADYLQELGGKVNYRRAEFIRLQIEAAKMPMTCSKREAEDKRLSVSWAGEYYPMPRCRCESCRIARRLLKLSCPDTVMDFIDSMREFEAPESAYSTRWVRGFPQCVRCDYDHIVSVKHNWQGRWQVVQDWALKAVRVHPITEFDVSGNAFQRLMQRRDQVTSTLMLNTAIIHDRQRDAFTFNFEVIDSEPQYFSSHRDAYQWIAKHLGNVARKEAGLPPLSTQTKTNAA